MVKQTVTVGDQEVQITETEDGFEAEPVEDEPEDGLYLRAESASGRYGFEIPVTGEFTIGYNESSGDNPHFANWNTDQDVSEMGNTGALAAEEIGDGDGHAAVSDFELIEY